MMEWCRLGKVFAKAITKRNDEPAMQSLIYWTARYDSRVAFALHNHVLIDPSEGMAIVTLQDDNIMTLQLYQAVGPSWLAGAVAAYGTASSSCTSSTRSATGCTRCATTGARAWKQTPWRSYTSWMWREEQSQRVSWLRVLPWPEQQPGVRRSCGCWCTEREWRADFWYFQKNTHILPVLCLARQGQPLPCSCTPESEHRVLSAGLQFAGHLSHRALGLPEL
jgi:hypothetical protein